MQLKYPLFAALVASIFLSIYSQSKTGFILTSVFAVVLAYFFEEDMLYLSILLFPWIDGKVLFGFTLTPKYIVIPAFCIAYIVHRIQQKQSVVVWHRPAIALYILLLYALVITPIQSLAINNTIDFGEYRSTIVNHPAVRGLSRVLFVVFLVLYATAIAQRKKVDDLIKLHIGVATVLCLGGIIIYAIDLFAPLEAGKLFLIKHQATPRLRATLLEPLFFAAYLLTVLPLTAWAIHMRKFWSRRVTTLALGVQSIAFLLTFSRAAFIGILLASGYLLLTSRHRSKIIWSSIITLPFLLSIAALLFTNDTIERIAHEQIISSFVPNTGKWWSTLSRLIAVEKAVGAFVQHPILGIGWENFIFYAGKNTISWITGTEQQVLLPEVTVFPLRVLAELGIVGFAIFLAFVWSLLSTVRKQSYYAFMMISLAGILFFISSVSFPFFWFALGLMMRKKATF